MVSSKAVIFVISTLIVVITFFYFALPVTTILHTSASELNTKSYFSITDAILDADKKSIGIADNIYLQKGYFIVFFRNNEVLDKILNRKIYKFYTAGYMYGGGGWIQDRNGLTERPHEVVPAKIYGKEKLSECGIDDACVCLINLDYKKDVNTWIYQLGLEKVPLASSFGFAGSDLPYVIKTRWKDGRFKDSTFEPFKLFKSVFNRDGDNLDIYMVGYDEGGHVKWYSTDFATMAFMDQIISGVGSRFSLTFVECKPMRELCTCDVCEFFKDEDECNSEKDRFGCRWDSDKERCYSGEQYPNATQDCSFWMVNNGVRQIYAITERAKFDYVVFKKDGCALQWFDSSKKPIGTDTVFSDEYGGELFIDGKGEDKDKIGACEPCFQTIPVEQCEDFQPPCCKEEAKCSPI